MNWNPNGDKVETLNEKRRELDYLSVYGQRVSKLWAGEDFSVEVVVPAGDWHFASRTFERMLFESLDGKGL